MFGEQVDWEAIVVDKKFFQGTSEEDKWQLFGGIASIFSPVLILSVGLQGRNQNYLTVG